MTGWKRTKSKIGSRYQPLALHHHCSYPSTAVPSPSSPFYSPQQTPTSSSTRSFLLAPPNETRSFGLREPAHLVTRTFDLRPPSPKTRDGIELVRGAGIRPRAIERAVRMIIRICALPLRSFPSKIARAASRVGSTIRTLVVVVISRSSRSWSSRRSERS